MQKIQLSVLVFLAASPQTLQAQTTAAISEVTLQRIQPSTSNSRTPTVIEQWVFRMRSGAEQCDVQFMRGNTVSSSHSYAGPDCSAITALANDAQRSNFADAVVDHQISDRQYFRIRLGSSGAWHNVSKVAPQSGSITSDGSVVFTDVRISAPQWLLWKIQLLGSGRR